MIDTVLLISTCLFEFIEFLLTMLSKINNGLNYPGCANISDFSNSSCLYQNSQCYYGPLQPCWQLVIFV